MSPVVDVLIPAYNAAETLRSAVRSIQAQSFADILIHVVDDGSSDATPDILADIAREEPRLRIHRQANGGIVAALNAGLAECRAEFVARHDADDLAAPDRIATQVAYLRAHGEVVAVGGAARHIGPDGRPLGTIGRPGAPDDADPFQIPSREPYIIHPMLTVRREAMQAVGGYRYVFHAEDTDLYWRLGERGRLVNLPEVLGDYRLHEGSISSGSALNGRIMALSSQLAALSARRRRAGRPDIAFDKGKLALYKQAASLDGMVRLAGADLDADERAYLARAVSAKLLELTSYRPYELEPDDCRFIGAIARAGYADLPAVARGVQNRHVSGAAARLGASGRLRDALSLLPPRLLPGWAARVALRVGVPKPLRPFLRRKTSRAALEK